MLSLPLPGNGDSLRKRQLVISEASRYQMGNSTILIKGHHVYTTVLTSKTFCAYVSNEAVVTKSKLTGTFFCVVV